MVCVKAPLTHSVVITPWSECPRHGQAFEAIKHTPFTTGNLS